MSATDPHHATHHALHRTVEAVWRIESARVIAGLTRLTRDAGLAEELAQEALLAHSNSGRRAVDLFRRDAVAEGDRAGWTNAPRRQPLETPGLWGMSTGVKLVARGRLAGPPGPG